MDIKTEDINVDDCYVLVVQKPEELEDIKSEIESNNGEYFDNVDANDESQHMAVDDKDKETEVKEIKHEVFEDSSQYVMNSQAELSHCSDNDDDDDLSAKVTRKTKRRKKGEIHSYVEDLRNQDPALRDNQEKLIEKLVEVMKSCVPKEPPDYFIRNTVNYECFFCGFDRNTRLSVAKHHYEEVHGPKYLMCYACGQRFRSKSCLHRHEKKCSADDAYIVLKARAIVVGRRGANRPFLDPFLEKKKKKRIPYKTPATRLHCSECTATFVSQVSLTSHMNLHQGVRPFRCDICPAAYTNKNALTRHVKSHNPDQYICDYCGKVMHHKQSIIDHVQLHMYDKRFVCEYDGCEARYSDRRSWRLHLDVVHRNLPMPYPCPLCDKRLGTGARLKIHMKKIHNADYMTRDMFIHALPKMKDPGAIQGTAAFIKEGGVLMLAPDCELQKVDPTDK